MKKPVARAVEYARTELVTCTTASKQLTSAVDRLIQRISASQTNWIVSWTVIYQAEALHTFRTTSQESNQKAHLIYVFKRPIVAISFCACVGVRHQLRHVNLSGRIKTQFTSNPQSKPQDKKERNSQEELLPQSLSVLRDSNISQNVQPIKWDFKKKLQMKISWSTLMCT